MKALSTVHEMEFHGDRLLLIDVDGKPYVVLRPAVDALGLDYWGQLQRLRRRSWATVCVTQTVAGDGKTREMVTVDVRTILMLLATVDDGRVSDAVRPQARRLPGRGRGRDRGVLDEGRRHQPAVHGGPAPVS